MKKVILFGIVVIVIALSSVTLFAVFNPQLQSQIQNTLNENSFHLTSFQYPNMAFNFSNPSENYYNLLHVTVKCDDKALGEFKLENIEPNETHIHVGNVGFVARFVPTPYYQGLCIRQKLW